MSYSRSSLRNQKAKLAADYNNLLKELSSHEMTSVGCYTIGETIGEGTYGKVKLGTHQLTGKQVAIKKISKQHASIIAREIHHHRQLDHPNIVKIYEIISTESAIHIISEHCPNGELFDLLADTGRFSEYRAQRWFHQLVNAMKECHRQGIIHRDLKLENILLDINDNCKICDFGFARYADNKQLLETFCGSLAYSAPEVIMRQKYTGPETDIWSLGVILYTLIAGELPFDDDSEIMMQRKIVNVDYELPTYFSPQVQDLISNILKHDPNERLTIDQILNHPWMLAIFDDDEKDEQHVDEEEEEEIGMDYDDDSSSSTRNSSRSDIDSIFSSPRFKNDEDDDDDLITELSSHDSYIHLLDNNNNNNGKSGDLMHLQQHYRRSGGASNNYSDTSKFSPQVRYSLGMMRPEEKARYTSSRPPRFSAPTVSNNKSTPTTSPLPCRSSLPLSLPAHRESIRPSSTSSTSSLDIPMSPIEQKVSSALLSAGFDEYMVQSMRSNACNSAANTLWNMLMEKQQMDISNHSMILSPESPLSADNSKILHANERWSSLINSPNRLSSQNTSSSIPTDSSCQTTLTYPPSLSSVTMDQMKQTTSSLSSATEMKSTIATMAHKPIEIDTSSQISYSSLSSKPSYSSLTNATSLTAKSSIRSISSTASSNTTSSHDNKAGWFTSVKTWFGGNSTKQDTSTRRPVSYRDFDVYQASSLPSSPSTFSNANTNSTSEYNQGQLTPPIYRSGTLKYRRHMLPGNEINVYEKQQQQHEQSSYHNNNNIKRMDPLVSPPPPTATMYSRPVADGLSIITTPKYVSSTAVPSHVQEVDICEERNPLYHQPLPPPAPPAPSYTNNSKNSNNRQCYQNPCLPKLPIQQQQKQKPVPQQQPSPPPSPPDSKPMIKEIPSIPSSTNNNNNINNNNVFSSSPAPSPIPTTRKNTTKDSNLLLTPPSINPIKLEGLLLSTTKEDNDMMHNNNINNYNINTVPTPTISTTSTLVEKENDNNNNNNNNEKVSPLSTTKDISPIPSLSSKSIQQSSPSIKPLSSRSSPPALLASNNNNSNNIMKSSSPIPSSNRRFEFSPRSRLSVYGMNDRGLMANKAIIEEEEEEE
ncbi:unnamed protein product [Cunninghamella echinulata]